jgi:uncharacterized MAPEG superfamily protein
MAELTLQKKQIWIGAQILISVLFQLLALVLGYKYAAFEPPLSDAMADRLVFAVQWSFWGVTILLAMIMFIAGIRPFRADAIDGDDKSSLALHVRVQRNTLEQLVLMVFGVFGLATIVELQALKIIPVLVCVFIVSRIVYWIGYVKAPHLRTLGFVATFYPNIGMIVYVAWQLLHR